MLNEYDITHEELSHRVNKSRAQITNTLRLLQLCDEVKTLLSEDKITQGHAKMLVTLDEKEQKLVADSIIGQKLSVRDTETLIKKIKDKTESSPKLHIKEHIKSLDNKLLRALQEELEELGIKSQINASKITLLFQSDDEITTLTKKISK